jgi:hypothetical protein
MRLPLISPSDLSPEQHRLYDDMRKGIETNFKGFKAIDSDGPLSGHGIHGSVSRSSADLSGSLLKPCPPRRHSLDRFAKSLSLSPARISTRPTSYTLTSLSRKPAGCRTKRSRPLWLDSVPQT